MTTRDEDRTDCLSRRSLAELELEVIRVAKESPDGPMTTAMTERMLRRAGR